MGDISLCERKISHKCRHRSKAKLIIIVNDYSDFEPIPTLSSAINDASVIWNLFRRRYCFNKSQIFVYGRVNIKGKMIAWKDRFNLPTDFSQETYFYYSGHGYKTGKLDIPLNIEKNLKNSKYLVIDACYAHLWYEDLFSKEKEVTFIGATSCDRDLTGSTKLISNFTYDLAKYLTNDNKSEDYLEDKEKLLPKFQDWIKEKKYSFHCFEEKMFVNDFLLN